MKILLLSLVFMGSAFAAQTDFSPTAAVNMAACTHCVDYAYSQEQAGVNWYKAYNNCLDNLNPCGVNLGPVVITAPDNDYTKP